MNDGTSRIEYVSYCFPVRSRLFLTATIFWTFCFTSPLKADDTNWPQFRGANSTGAVESKTNLPEKWSATENVVWKTDIPGRGWSSPIVWEDKIFLTTVVSLGETEEPKKGLYFGGERGSPKAVHQWFVLCLSLKTGEKIWEHKVREEPPKSSIHLKNSFASETPVTDGKQVYFTFGNVGIFCFDMEGNKVWEKPLKPHKTRLGWGTAASPAIHGDHLYVVDDNDEESSMMVLNKKDGSVHLTIPREEKSNWSTPFVWKNDKRTEIVTPGTVVRSYDLDGKVLWSLKGMSSITIATPYEYDGKLIISSGYVGDVRRPLYAISPGASGDISLEGTSTSNEFIAWSHFKGGPYNPSTIPYDGKIYVLHDRGFVAAYNASDGEVVYEKKRLKNGRAFTTSPWAYNGKLFFLNESGVTYVVQAGEDFKILDINKLGEDDMCMATPALVGDKLLIRTEKRIYCFAKQK